MSNFVGLIYYSVFFGGFYPTLWGLYIIMPSSEGFVPTSVGFVNYYVLFGGFCPNVCWVVA